VIRPHTHPFHVRSLAVAIIAGLLFGPELARADIPQGKLTHDITVGTNHDVQLHTGQVVQVMKDAGGQAVIMVALPDGSNGVFQIDATDVELLAADVPPPSPAPAPAPAATTPKHVVQSPAPAAAPRPAEPSTPPAYPDDFVGGPEFDTTAGRQAAGTASIVKLKGGTQTYIVSARHLLGPEGGFAKQTPAEKVPEFVKSIDISSFSGGNRHYDVTGLLVPAKQLKPIGGPPVNDMAVYLNQDSSAQSQAVVLADQVPAVGEPVWVIARVRGGVPEGEIMHSAKVISNNGWLVIQFDNDNIITAGASGAPVLNAAGEVVGVYSAHSTTSAHKTGFIIPAPLIAAIIKK
jgi:hypothetical protein